MLPKEEILAILAQFNPWWQRKSDLELPLWKRELFSKLMYWIVTPPVHRALLVSGPRQVGKTTLLLQAIQQLLMQGTPPANILYVTFDHPALKHIGLQAILEIWRELEPKMQGVEYLFLDEAHCIPDFGTWIKHTVDFSKHRRVIFTGSAMPLLHANSESGVGRWHTLSLSTLSFYEYVHIKNIAHPPLAIPTDTQEIIQYSPKEWLQIEHASKALTGHFHEYLCRGGFPQTIFIENIAHAQQLLREDIIDKVLKRDMTSLFGIRRIAELEQLFLYLCLHDGGIQDVQTLSTNLQVTKSTVQNFIHVLEASHLLYRLSPYGYGKEVLRGRHKLYLVDPALAAAIFLKGKTLLTNPIDLGKAVEGAIFSHLRTHCPPHTRFSYWKDTKHKECDFVLETETTLVPIEVKYQSQKTTCQSIPGLLQFFLCTKNTPHGYVVTKMAHDLGILPSLASSPPIIRIPAPVFCYWLGHVSSRPPEKPTFLLEAGA